MLPWSDALAAHYTFEDRFDELVTVYKKSLDGQTILVPRGHAKMSPKALDQRDPGIAVNFTSSFAPQKSDQLSVIEQSVKILQEEQGVIVCAPTGWGKTYVGAEVCARLGRRFCVITTKEDIIGQWKEAIQSVLGLSSEEIGVWRGDSVPKPSHKAVIALVQSVMKGPDRYGLDPYLGFGTVLCDEVHRMGAEHFSQTMWHFPSLYRIGVSATPERKDGRDRVFRWHIGEKTVFATQDVLPFKVLRHQTGWKVPRSSQGQIPHDFGDTMALMKPMTRNPQRNALILQYLCSALGSGRSTIAFSEVTEHLEIIRDLLLAAGIPESKIGFYVGTPSDLYEGPPKGQKALREKQKIRPILLATYKMASEATNLPWVDTCVMMTPRADAVQTVGRIRREYEDKKMPLVVDLIDSDSLVLREYAAKRNRWYMSLGAQVVNYAASE
jgi:superfamily II DNA or RNA helicase